MSRKNISLHEQIEERANQIIVRRGMAGLSDLIAVLVREEYERRGFDAIKDKANSNPMTPAAAKVVQIVKYPKLKAPK